MHSIAKATGDNLMELLNVHRTNQGNRGQAVRKCSLYRPRASGDNIYRPRAAGNNLTEITNFEELVTEAIGNNLTEMPRFIDPGLYPKSCQTINQPEVPTLPGDLVGCQSKVIFH